MRSRFRKWLVELAQRAGQDRIHADSHHVSSPTEGAGETMPLNLSSGARLVKLFLASLTGKYAVSPWPVSGSRRYLARNHHLGAPLSPLLVFLLVILATGAL